MAGKITTLYVDDTSVRLAVTRGKRISKLADVPLDTNLGGISTEAGEAQVVAKIKYLFKANKVKAKKVIIGLSGLHCLSRPVVLPQLPRAMLDEAVIREARRVLPVPPEQLYISWQITSATEGRMQAFMVAIPRQIADRLLRILHQAGLKPYLMDIKPLALARLVPEATAVIVDVQSTEFDIVIIVDGVPQPIRTVSFPQAELSLPDKLLIVKDELTRTVQFYNTNNPGKPIQPGATIFASGGLADEPESFESLSKELGYKVLPLSSPLKCPKQLDPAPYLVSIGLALKGLPKEVRPLLTNINTLPVPYQAKPVSLTKVMALPTAAVAIGLIAVLATTVQDVAASIDSVRSKLDITNSVLVQRQSQKKELLENIAALQQKMADTEAARSIFTTVFDDIGRQGDAIDADLEATVDNLVGSVTLNSIAHSDKGLNIKGTAPSEVEVLSYARNLDATGRFSEVTVANISRIEERDGVVGGDSDNVTSVSVSVHYDFSLVLKLKGSE